MKKMRRALAMLLACLMVIVAFPTVSKAAGKTYTLKEGKTVVAREYGDFYKITVKGDGYITLSAAAVPTTLTGNMYGGSVRLCMADKDTAVYGKDGKYSVDFDKSGKFASVQFPVSAGTYFIRSYSDCKIKFNFKAVKPATNYCKAKATEMKKNKSVTIMQTPDYAGNRWFKIKLTKKQAITFTGSVSLYSSDFKIVNANNVDVVGLSNKWQSTSGKTIKTPVLKKGTYYVRVRETFDSYYSIKWK